MKDNVKVFESRGGRRIVLQYILFAGLWILVSDGLLGWMIRDIELLILAQTYKGWLFVGVSGLILYGLLQHESNERLKMDLSRQKSEERYRNLVNQACDVIFLADANGVIQMMNPFGLRLSGYEVVDGQLLSLDQLLYSPGDQPTPLYFHELGFDKTILEECQLRRSDGYLLPVEVNARKLQDGSIQGIVRDVSDRKKTEQTIQQWADIFRFTKSGIAISQPSTLTIDLANPALAEMYGSTMEELIGMPVEQLFVGDFRTSLSDHFQLASKKEHHTFETELLRKDGTIFPAQVDVTVVKDKPEKVLYQILNVQDISERKTAEAATQKQLQRLAALRSIDMAITATLDQRVTFNVLLDQVISQLDCDAAAILILNSVTRRLEYAALRGFQSTRVRDTFLPARQGLPGVVAVDMTLVSIPDLRHTDLPVSRQAIFEEENFITYHGVPLIAKGELKGVLEVFHRKMFVIDQEWLDFLEALAGQAAIAIDNTTLYENLQRSSNDLIQAYDATLEGWSHALELRDRETRGHSERVTELTLKIAQEMGFSDVDLIHIRRGTLLHDIGKMGIPDSILLKPGPLLPDEWVIMRRHPIYAFEMLAPIPFLRHALEIPYCHHERWDGTGYPRGLKGEQIPLAARIFSVVDVWDALSSDRPYRKSWPASRVRSYIQERAGTHFDPKVVNTFLQSIFDDRGGG